MGIVIYPPQYPVLRTPLVFLAGPIQGTDDWQDLAIKRLHASVPDLLIANPRRPLPPDFQKKDFTVQMWEEQVDWESYHLNRADTLGGIMFWLANETITIPHRAYAQTSRVE